jgi:hypothetical protein
MFSVSEIQMPVCSARIATSGGSCVLSELWDSKYGDGASLRQVRVPAQRRACAFGRAQIQGHDADDESAGLDAWGSAASGLGARSGTPGCSGRSGVGAGLYG